MVGVNTHSDLMLYEQQCTYTALLMQIYDINSIENNVTVVLQFILSQGSFLLQKGNERLCLICHENMRMNGGVQELHCTHRFHKEVQHPLHVFPSPWPSVQRPHHLFPQVPACQISDNPGAWRPLTSWTRMMWSGMTSEHWASTCMSMGHTYSFLVVKDSKLTDCDVSVWLGAVGGSQVGAVSATQQRQRGSGFSGEETLGGEEEVGRRPDLHGERAADTPSATFPAETSLILFSGRRWRTRWKMWTHGLIIRLISCTFTVWCETGGSADQVPGPWLCLTWSCEAAPWAPLLCLLSLRLFVPSVKIQNGEDSEYVNEA